MNKKEWFASLGHVHGDVPMKGKIDEWWNWYTASGDFYESTETDGKRIYKVKRISMHPAGMVCEDWTSLTVNESAEVGITGDEGDTAAAIASEYLKEWVKAERFIERAPENVQRMYALGTSAWALRLEGISDTLSISKDARFIPQRFDARSIFPLTFDEDGCTECAFESEVTIAGRRLTQVQLYQIGDRGTYEIHTAHFDDKGKRVVVDGIAATIDTRSKIAPFALMRPGLDNTYWDYSPFGVSVFDRASGPIEVLENALNGTNSDLELGQKMVFVPEDMLEVDSDGNTIVPWAKGQRLFRKTVNDTIGESSGIHEYNPALRIADNRMALSTALELLSKRCGFGPGYYSLEQGGGIIKTATEVSSDNSELMRNRAKHERSVGAAIAAICESVVDLGRTMKGLALPDVTGRVRVVFDDSIIEDTESKRRRDLEDVAAGALALWEYRMKWYAEDEETARAAVGEMAFDPFGDATI